MSPPVIYEINTSVWLGELQQRYGGPMGLPLDLTTVPMEAWDELAVPGVDVIWLMGVWQRSPGGRAIALADPAVREAGRRALPDLRDDDITGSPYCVRGYVADERFGGRDGLAVARAELDRRGLGLFLDYVPNHVAPDHPWVREHPEFFVRGTREDLSDPEAFLELDGLVYARGRDPYFPPWRDVVQLNAFAPELRAATVDTLAEVGEQCDGVRCDMAMLLMNGVFAKTWGERAGPPPAAEFWPEVLGQVRERRPDMTFVAEAYWDLEAALQAHGFDFCYDKRLYDRLVHDGAEAVRVQLSADVAYQRGLVRFLENHDEPRAAGVFGPAQERAAAVTIATLPGATLWHEGQFDGRRVRIPVQLARRPEEQPDVELRGFHERLLGAVHGSGMRAGEWRPLECTGWADNPSHRDLVAWCWTDGAARHVVVVNLSGRAAQARIPLPWDDLGGRSWELRDLLTDVSYERDGSEMGDPGLYVALDAWAVNVFAMSS